MRLGIVILAGLLAASAAQSAPSETGKLVLSAGLLSDGQSLGIQANGHLLFKFETVSLDLGLGEALTGSGSVGSVFVGMRRPWRADHYLRAGLAHHHRVGHSLLLANPFGSLLGVASGIDHRSGLEVAIGWLGRRTGSPLLPVFLRHRSRWIADLALAFMPGKRGARWTTTLSLGTRFGIGTKKG